MTIKSATMPTDLAKLRVSDNRDRLDIVSFMVAIIKQPLVQTGNLWPAFRGGAECALISCTTPGN